MGMTTRIEAQKTEMEEMTARIAALTEEMAKVQATFEETAATLEATETKLSETEGTLHATVSTLHATEAELKTTTQEREEQKHLVAAHVEAETELHGEASTLMSVVGTSVSHVAGLHSKLERKTAVEEHNRDTSAQFQARFGRAVSSLSEGAASFAAAQAEATRQLAAELESARAARTQELGELLEKVQSFGDECTPSATPARTHTITLETERECLYHTITLAGALSRDALPPHTPSPRLRAGGGDKDHPRGRKRAALLTREGPRRAHRCVGDYGRCGECTAGGMRPRGHDRL